MVAISTLAPLFLLTASDINEPHSRPGCAEEGHISGILVAVGRIRDGLPTTRRHSQPGYEVVHHAGGFANIMTPSISDGTCPRFAAALSHFQQRYTSASIRIATRRVSCRSCYLAGGLVCHVNPLSIPRYRSEQVTLSRWETLSLPSRRYSPPDVAWEATICTAQFGHNCWTECGECIPRGLCYLYEVASSTGQAAPQGQL